MAIGAAIGGAFLKANATSKAAKAKAAAANTAIGFQRETRDDTIQRFEPFYQSGLGAQNALAFELGLGDKPENYRGFQATPGYEFGLKQGRDAIEASAAARGNLVSGSTLKALGQFGQDYASGEYNNYLNRLAGSASSGQAAAGNQAAAGQFFSSGATNALSSIGSANAGRALATGDILSGGLNTVGDYYDKRQEARKNDPFSQVQGRF